MRAADEAGLVGVVADQIEVDVGPLSLQNDGSSTHSKLADAALLQAAADHDALRVAPFLGLEVAPDDAGQLVGVVLDRALDDTGALRVPLHEEPVEPLLADVLARRLAERVLVDLLQALAQIVEKGPEGSAAGAVADESVLVLDLEVVAVDRHGGQARRAMAGQDRLLFLGGFGHDVRSRAGLNGSRPELFHRLAGGG